MDLLQQQRPGAGGKAAADSATAAALAKQAAAAGVPEAEVAAPRLAAAVSALAAAVSGPSGRSLAPSPAQLPLLALTQLEALRALLPGAVAVASSEGGLSLLPQPPPAAAPLHHPGWHPHPDAALRWAPAPPPGAAPAPAEEQCDGYLYWL